MGGVRHAPLWVVLFLASVATVALVWSPPIPCSADQKCATARSDARRDCHILATVGLATLMLREITVLVEAVQEAMQSEATIWSKKDRILPPFLMCLVLVSITTFDAVYAFTSQPWAHVMPPSGGLVDTSRPVHTLRYLEWIISVPIMLMLTGYCALGRPIKEVLAPIIVTDVYVTLAWVAMVVSSPWLRWFVVCACFMGYYFASLWMWRWASMFLSTAPEETPSRHLRASLVVLLVSLFGLYAVVYLGAMLNFVGADTEKVAYTFLGFLAKVAMSCIFTSIRASEHRQTLDSLLCRVGSLNTTLMSLLRGSFDVVLPCSATEDGCCRLSDKDTGEMRELGIFLGHAMSGVEINTMLAGAEERERFAVYVRNCLRQVDGKLPFGKARWSVAGDWVDSACGQKPPLAQVLNVKMVRNSVSGSSIVNVLVYLAGVPRSTGLVPGENSFQMVAAFRFEDCVPLPTLLPETSPAVAIAENHKQESPKQHARSKKPAATGENTERPARMSHAMKVVAKKKVTKILTRKLGGGGSSDTRPSTGSHAKNSSRSNSKGSATSTPAQPTEDRLGRLGPSLTRVRYPGVADVLYGQDVMSQSSKLSGAGSITEACQKLLGPLLNELPPKQLRSRRVEDHVTIAAEMTKMKVPAEIARLHHQQEMVEWKERCRARTVSEMLQSSSTPENGLDDAIWRNEILPKLEAPAPGKMPETPDLPDDEELWLRAWRATYEESNEDENADLQEQ